MTPSPTAAATGSSRVATNVAMTAICEAREVRMMARTCPVRRDPMAATISTAASVGMATVPTTPENASRMIAIQMPAKIAAQRSRAPAATLRAVWPTEPPTGCPRKRPDSRFPTPWARKSRFGSDRRAVRVRGRLADAGSLDQHERRDGTGAQDDVGGELAELGECGQRQAARDLADVAHALDRVGAQGDHRHRRDHQCDQRRVGSQPRAGRGPPGSRWPTHP